MQNSFVLDLQSQDSIKAGLKWLLKDKYKDFNNLFAQYIFSDNLDEKEEFTLNSIEEELGIDWNKIDLENLEIKIYHFTTRTENQPIQDIYNLYYLLSNETQLSNFFKSHKIEFELENFKLYVNGKVFNLKEKGFSSNEALYWIHTKLYIDPEIWGFLRVKDIRDYNSDFPNRPEFISHVADLLGSGTSLLEDWDNTYGVPCVIEFNQPFHSVQILSDFILYKKDFMRREFLSEEEFGYFRDQYILEMKKGLCDLLIALFMDNVSRFGVKELARDRKENIKGLLNGGRIKKMYGGFGMNLCAVLPKNTNVSKSKITKVWDYNEFQNDAMYKLGFETDI